jgi:hypothetical protein
MNIFYYLQYYFVLNTIFTNFNVFSLKLFPNAKQYKTNLYTNIKKMSVLSKIVYEYNYDNNKLCNKNKKKFNIKSELDIKTNLTIDFIKNNNIYFDSFQHTSFLNNNDFTKTSEKHLDFINSKFPDTEIYGYFNDNNRLHLIILINHKLSEINVVYRGSLYFDEWYKNLKINEVELSFNDKYKIHKGLFQIYTNYNIDNNIIYILKNLFNYFPKYRKIFTGHSRGSIFCFLTVIELMSKLKEQYKYEIICFGSPQILNKKIADFLHNHKNIDIYNIINENDIVSYLPFFNKYHVGTEILLKEHDISIIEHKNPYQKKYDVLEFFKYIQNHDLKIYIDKLNKFL